MNIQQMSENSAQAVVLLKAMANENRLQILCLLHHQEMSVGELCKQLTLSQSALSQHLAWLKKDGLVKTRKEAQTVFYTLHSDEVIAIINVLHTLYCQEA